MISLLENMHTSIVKPNGGVTSCKQKEGKAGERSYHHILPLLFLSAYSRLCVCVSVRLSKASLEVFSHGGNERGIAQKNYLLIAHLEKTRFSARKENQIQWPRNLSIHRGKHKSYAISAGNYTNRHKVHLSVTQLKYQHESAPSANTWTALVSKNPTR